ncbi:MAG: PIN domain-containing protein [Clostridiaceae bacterium]
MKNAIWEYIGLTNEEKDTLWSDCVFIFDANVLLNLYRYSRNTSDRLLSAFTELSDRIWLPYQVAFEFMKNRCEVIIEVRKKYDSIENDKLAFLKKALSLSNATDGDPAIKSLCASIDAWIAESKKENIRVVSPSNDDILRKLLVLFEKKTGAPFDAAVISTLKAEGEKRFARKVPPGYADQKKKNSDADDNNAYGDFFTWQQIIDYAKENKTNLVLVTNDLKEDWWQIAHGETIGPRVELRKEFVEKTGKQFHMYTMNQFLEIYKTSYKRDVNQSVIDEVSRITFYLERNKKQNFSPVDKLAFSILKKQAKVSRMQRTLNNLDEKYPFETMPDDIRTQYENTKRNMLRVQNDITTLNMKYDQILSRDNSNC